MKRNNKGFTLAELLIVIAIIAILIAIAVPVFAGQLENARLQTDHANIRNCYAIAQVANLEGGMTTPTGEIDSSDTVYYFHKDGSLGATGNDYTLMANGETGTKCETSAACATAYFTHAKDSKIVIRKAKSTDTGATVGEWIVANS